MLCASDRTKLPRSKLYVSLSKGFESCIVVQWRLSKCRVKRHKGCRARHPERAARRKASCDNGRAMSREKRNLACKSRASFDEKIAVDGGIYEKAPGPDQTKLGLGRNKDAGLHPSETVCWGADSAGITEEQDRMH